MRAGYPPPIEPTSSRAFTLVELAVVLLLSGLAAGLLIKYTSNSKDGSCYTETKAKIERLRGLVNTYAQSNDRFPMPARRLEKPDSPTYGREVKLDTSINPDGDISPDLDSISNADGTVAVFGAFPFASVSASQEDAVDCWGHKLSYVVSKSLTLPKDANGKSPFINGVNGAINIKTDASSPTTPAFLAGAGYAILSHGADGVGAVKAGDANPGAAGYPGSTRKWCQIDASGWGKTENCDLGNSVLVNMPYNDGKAATGIFFDDLIAYRGKPWASGNPQSCLCTGPGPVNVYTTGPEEIWTANPICN